MKRTPSSKRRTVQVAGSPVLALAMSMAALPGADAAMNDPQISGPNVYGYATQAQAGSHHDIDRKHCDWTGCGWLDGTNTNTNSSGSTYAVRGAYCDTHRYRHQGQNGDSSDLQLTYTCP